MQKAIASIISAIEISIWAIAARVLANALAFAAIAPILRQLLDRRSSPAG